MKIIIVTIIGNEQNEKGTPWGKWQKLLCQNWIYLRSRNKEKWKIKNQIRMKFFWKSIMKVCKRIEEWDMWQPVVNPN